METVAVVGPVENVESAYAGFFCAISGDLAIDPPHI